MAKPAGDWDNPRASLEDTKYGIGQRADGTVDIFPASELPARIAAERSQDEAVTYAMQQSSDGFPDEPEDDGTEIDQAELERMLEEPPADGDQTEA